jgi:hypothetical protein
VDVAPAWPWLPADLSGGVTCGVVCQRRRHADESRLIFGAALVRWLEDNYGLLPPVNQRAWCELFDQIYGPPNGYGSIPYAVARAALDTLEADPSDNNLRGWCELRDELRASPADAALVVWSATP